LGTPYPEEYPEEALADLEAQAKVIADNLRDQIDGLDDPMLEKREMIALIAYLQRLGTDIKPRPQAEK
jgi:cytochrome c oxidase cbb3-type subunit I/II